MSKKITKQLRIPVEFWKKVTADALSRGVNPNMYAVSLMHAGKFHMDKGWKDLANRMVESEESYTQPVPRVETPVKSTKQTQVAVLEEAPPAVPGQADVLRLRKLKDELERAEIELEGYIGTPENPIDEDPKAWYVVETKERIEGIKREQDRINAKYQPKKEF